MGIPDEAAKASIKKKQRLRENVKKWSRTVLKAGFTMLPAILFTKQKQLELSPVDLSLN
jgi:hypothetical protein